MDAFEILNTECLLLDLHKQVSEESTSVEIIFKKYVFIETNGASNVLKIIQNKDNWIFFVFLCMQVFQNNDKRVWNLIK